MWRRGPGGRDLLERVYRITGSVAASAGALLALGVKPAYADPMTSSPGAPPRQAPGGSPLFVPANEIGGILTAPGARDQFVRDYQSAMGMLRQQSFVDPNRIGMTGYCYGGGITYMVAAAEPTLRAAAPYYGPVMDATGLRNTRAAVLGVYAETDNNVNASIPAVEEALSAARVPFRVMRYPNSMHAFFNDTRPSYAEAAALGAWRDTLAWFNTYLRGGALPQTGDGSQLLEEEVAAE